MPEVFTQVFNNLAVVYLLKFALKRDDSTMRSVLQLHAN